MSILKFKLLRIDLTRMSSKVEELGDDVIRKYIGGRGLGAYLALKEIPKGADPFGPENKVYILTGPLVGTASVESGRYHVVAKSPLTGILGDANSGGQFGPWLRFAGYDGVVLEGKSEDPVWISITNGEVKFHDAKKMWGKGVLHTEKMIRDEVGVHDESIGSILSVGPAAENLSRIAAVMNDKYRAAGRAGLASVIASKGVKAIWAYGNRKPTEELYDRKGFFDEAKKVIEKIRAHDISKALNQFGTAVLVNIINEHGAFPTRNWQQGTFDKAYEISGEKLADTYLKARKGCWGCVILCSRVSEVEEGPFMTPLSEGPEYETIWANGGSTMISELAALVKANYLMNDMGFDTISFGSTVAALMELYERALKGELPEEKAKELIELAGDVNPVFGNPHALIQLIWMAAYRNRIGDYVAEGAMRLAEYFGYPEAAIHVRGMELPAYDPRGINSMALSYATSNRGGCHLRAYSVSFDVLGVPKKFDPLVVDSEKVELVKMQQDYFSFIDSVIVCKFNTFSTGPEDYVGLMKTAMGWDDYSAEELLTTGERIYNVERLFAVREGHGYKDTLPKRLMETPLPDGPAKGKTTKEAMEKYLPEYYRIRGWSDGKPLPETLDRLGLQEFKYILS